jgi:DNA polymerase-3 subunit epsilon
MIGASGTRQITWAAVLVAVVVLVLAVLAALPVVGGNTAPLWLIGAIATFSWLALMIAHEAARRHYDDLKLVQAGLEALALGQLPPPILIDRFKGKGGLAIGRLAKLIADIATRRAQDRGKPDQRLASVLGALKDGVVVITESGQISLVNAAAKAFLGGDRAAIGTSIYAALDRGSLLGGLYRAHSAGCKAVEIAIRTLDGREITARIADFGEHKGAVITFEAVEIEHAGEVDMALDLHDRPPEAPPPIAATLLDELPALVLDTETTGLDTTRDRIVSIGAVRVHGARIFRSTAIDRLVNPGKGIPPQSTAVHGITNAMVADQPDIAATLPELLEHLKGTVVVGHNIPFDLALLRRAAEQCKLPWPDPPFIDIILLAGALDPEATDLNLDTMAKRMGVNIAGRHTALGDALVTAELYVRLLPQLAREGVHSLGEAQAFSAKATHLIAQQKLSGWMD